MSDKPLLLLQTGDAPPPIRRRCGNFDQMFFAVGGLDPAATRTIRLEAGERPDHPSAYRGCVITGSHSMVTDREDWSEAAAKWLRTSRAEGLPLFGVCYGHQLMAYAFGGTVDYLDGGAELGGKLITLTKAGAADPLLRGFPKSFHANLSHSQTVVGPPAGAMILAGSDRDPRQILRYGPQTLSVQFHPEFDQAAMAAYLDYSLPGGSGTGGLGRRTMDTPWARRLLAQFVRDAQGREAAPEMPMDAPG